MGLLHVVVGGPGDVGAVGVADSDEVGLVLRSIAHEVEVRRGPVAVLDGPALEAGQLAGEDIEPLEPEMGSGRQSRASMRRKAATQEPMPRASESTAAAEVTSLRQSCRQPKLYIGEKRLKPSDDTNAVARLAGMERASECSARFFRITSGGDGFFNV